MQRLTDEQMREMNEGPKGVMPEFHPIRDAWLRVLDVIVRITSFGQGRVVPCSGYRAPIRWDGVIK